MRLLRYARNDLTNNPIPFLSSTLCQRVEEFVFEEELTPLFNTLNIHGSPSVIHNPLLGAEEGLNCPSNLSQYFIWTDNPAGDGTGGGNSRVSQIHL